MKRRIRPNDSAAPWLRYVTAATVDMVRYYAQDNPEMLAEGASAADRARAAGAVGVLDLQGIGMTAWVFCDEQGVAFKVARNMTPSSVEMLAREAEWLRVANAVPGVKMHVARFYRWHPEVGVIVRECVRQRDRSTMRRRKQEGDLWDLHHSIERSMLPYGFTAPELKADSYVFTRDRGYVLVDAGFVHKTGSRLARDIAAKHRDQSMRKEELSLERGVMRSEYGRTIDPEVGARLERRLAASRPNGARASRRPRGRINADRLNGAGELVLRPGDNFLWFVDGSLQKASLGGTPRGAIALYVSARRRFVEVENASRFDPGSANALREFSSVFGLDWSVSMDGAKYGNLADFLASWREFDTPLRWYHGTSSANIDSIMSVGLRPRMHDEAVFVGGASESNPDFVYLSADDGNDVRFAARASAKATKSTPVILLIDGRGVDERLLRPDEDSRAATWLDSLRATGTVAYEGIVPPSAVSVHLVLSHGGWVSPGTPE